jgi:hypothetical protein
MTTIYTFDSRGIYSGAVPIENPKAPVPAGLLTAPPVLTGTQVAQAVGNAWVVLPEYPPVPPVPPKTPEQLREEAKAARAAAVGAITVTTAAGNTFDGDEVAQTRMARAVLVLSTGAALSVPWVLADNTVIQADAVELTEALALAGAAQAALWVLP